ncbi:MAG: RNA methyltransferase [Oscillospiraceae bacterium]|nr:RNA methyltransferase [Oscillospiraceae bacterium]
METITSRTNPIILDTIRLREAKHRRDSGLFAFEGKKLFLEALEKGIDLKYVFFTDVAKDFCISALEKSQQKCRRINISGSVYEKLSAEKSPEGIFCVAGGLDKRHKFATIYKADCNASESSRRTRLMLSSLRDPGNVGTIIRSAVAFGVDELILSADCVDIYNPKVIRAAMGALFSMKIIVVKDFLGSVLALQESGCAVYAAALSEDAHSLRELSILPNSVFIIGNEANGVPPEVISAADACVYIPMAEGVESLNAAVAASVLLWEAKFCKTIGGTYGHPKT